MDQNYTVKFDALKRKAVQAFAARQLSAFRRGKVSGEGAVLALQFLQLNADERARLIAYADAFKATVGDEIAISAKQREPYAIMALRAREDGIRGIGNCDVRQAGVLVSQFPNILPRRLRGKSFSAYMADNDACDWMLEFAEPMRRAA